MLDSEVRCLLVAKCRSTRFQCANLGSHLYAGVHESLQDLRNTGCLNVGTYIIITHPQVARMHVYTYLPTYVLFQGLPGDPGINGTDGTPGLTGMPGKKVSST